MQMNSNIPMIATRHKGVIEWLRRRGITGEYIRRPTMPHEVAGRVVYGVLPEFLANYTITTYFVRLPNGFREYKGIELSADDLERLGAYIHQYTPKKRKVLAG
jgi:putative CRISPR-associated protein (TIGR02620 family)